MCQSCKTLMARNALWSLGMLGLSWGTFSLYTVNLFSITYAPQQVPPKPIATPAQATSSQPSGGYVSPPKPERPPEVLLGDYVPYAKDNKGKTASFVIHLLTDEYRWKLSRWDLLENLQSEIEFSSPMRRLMNRAVEIICVGASSEEIEKGLALEEGRTREEWRAAQRAESIAKWTRAVLDHPVNVRKLNIGHRDPSLEGTDAFDTSEQRRVIIVLVLKEEDGINIDEALRDAFLQERARQPIYETILTKYSLTQGLKFHWEE